MRIRKMMGFIAFWIAVGMLLMFFLTNRFVALIIIALLVLIGYNCYYCD